MIPVKSVRRKNVRIKYFVSLLLNGLKMIRARVFSAFKKLFEAKKDEKQDYEAVRVYHNYGMDPMTFVCPCQKIRDMKS